MKNKIIQLTTMLAFATLLIYSQLGCKKFLDRKPLGQVTVGDIQGGGVEGDLFGLYAATRNWGMSQLPFITGHASRADDAYVSTPGDGNSAYVDQFDYSTKDYWVLTALWDDHLAFIIRASAIIKDIETLGSINPAIEVNKAEASFLRAYAYFDMVRDYGGVPKIDFKVITADQANVPRATADEIYAFIESDLQFAAQVLPDSWESKFKGRITKGAANALLAKVYLYRNNWASALSSAETVINSGNYALLPNFSDVFTEENENGSEVLFGIQNYENADGSVGSYGSYGTWSTGYQGVRASGDWNLGWGWNIPSQGLVDTVFESGDPRKGQTILFSGAPDDTLINDGRYGNTLPPSIWPYFNKKVYTDPARRAATGDMSGSWLDMIIMRYSDVLLMAGEAANETGNSAKALGYLEQVRARARKGRNVLPQITSTDQTVIRAAIKHERRVEFALEWERFYDLVRWGDAERVLGPLGYTSKQALLPIPQGAIDKSNGVLTQNQGY